MLQRIDAGDLVMVTMADGTYPMGLFRANRDIDPQAEAEAAQLPLNPAGTMGPFLHHLVTTSAFTGVTHVTMNLDSNRDGSPRVTVQKPLR